MPRVLALRQDGSFSYCCSPMELRGRGRCNHIAHREEGESYKDFVERASNMTSNTNNVIKNKKTEVEKQSATKKREINRGSKLKNNENIISKEEKQLEDDLVNIYFRISNASFNPGTIIESRETMSESEIKEILDRNEDYKRKSKELAKEFSEKERIQMVKNGENIKILMRDESFNVKMEIIKENYDVKEMLLDKDPRVRMAIADRCFEIPRLYQDPDPKVSKYVKNLINSYYKYNKNNPWVKNGLHPNLDFMANIG